MTRPQLFKRNQIEVQAIQWTGDNREAFEQLYKRTLECGVPPTQMEKEKDDIPTEAYWIKILTNKGEEALHKGDWAIKLPNGEIEMCKGSEFELMHEKV